MLKTLLSTTYVRNYHAIMHSMQVASQSASGVHPIVPIRCAWLCPCFTTFSRRAVKRSVLVEATKKDPEELVKRIIVGEKVAYVVYHKCCIRHLVLVGHIPLAAFYCDIPAARIELSAQIQTKATEACQMQMM